MKHIIGCVTVGSWLLLSSVGVALAADPHNPTTGTGVQGQPGSINGTSCGMTTNGGLAVGGGPGNSINAPGSPFNTGPDAKPKEYAGNAGNPTGPGGTASNSTHAVSEYDVACFQHSQAP